MYTIFGGNFRYTFIGFEVNVERFVEGGGEPGADRTANDFDIWKSENETDENARRNDCDCYWK